MKEWEKNIRQVTPYVPGEQPNDSNMIKLNTNENPYPPCAEVKKALKMLDSQELRLYSEVTNGSLVSALAKKYDLADNQVFVGVGSDDVLAIAFMTFFNGKKPILFPDITYSFYDVWAELFGIPYECPKLDDAFRIKKEDYYKENGGVVIANPNAPTSIGEDLSFIQDIIEHNQDVIVIIDEAYVDFGGESSRKLLDQYENLLVVQTFSKSRSLAGMRIGYAMGNARLIKAMNDVKYSFNSYTMNTAALKVGVAALKGEEYFNKTTQTIIETREKVKEELRRLGFTFPDSKTNFLFVTHSKLSAVELFTKLRERSIYVRHFNKPRINNYLRITIGTEEEMNILIKVLREIIMENSQQSNLRRGYYENINR